jgi:hypothetical protein
MYIHDKLFIQKKTLIQKRTRRTFSQRLDAAQNDSRLTSHDTFDHGLVLQFRLVRHRLGQSSRRVGHHLATAFHVLRDRRELRPCAPVIDDARGREVLVVVHATLILPVLLAPLSPAELTVLVDIDVSAFVVIEHVMLLTVIAHDEDRRVPGDGQPDLAVLVHTPVRPVHERVVNSTHRVNGLTSQFIPGCTFEILTS